MSLQAFQAHHFFQCHGVLIHCFSTVQAEQTVSFVFLYKFVELSRLNSRACPNLDTSG